MVLYQVKSNNIVLDRRHFDFFFCSSQAQPDDLPDEVVTPILTYRQNGYQAAPCQKTILLTPVYIDYLAQLCTFLSHQYQHSTLPKPSFAKNHPITLFHDYVENAVLPSINKASIHLTPTINHLLQFAFAFGSASCKSTMLKTLSASSFIAYLLERNPQTLQSIFDYLSHEKSPPIDYYDFLIELNQQILNTPEPQHLSVLAHIVNILDQAPSKHMVASFSATYLLVTLYTKSHLNNSELSYYAKKINPPALFSQSIGQILYLLAIYSPANTAPNDGLLFSCFVKLIENHYTSECFDSTAYASLTTQYAINHGRIDVLLFLHDHKLTLPSKSALQLIMRNNKSHPYPQRFFTQMRISPQDLATNILQSSHCNHLSVFSYLDHLQQTLHLLPDAFNNVYMATTFSELILKLGPTFSEYHRLDPQGDYADSFLKIIDTIASKGGCCDNLPVFFPKVASLYLNQSHNQSSPTTTQRLRHILDTSLTNLLTNSSAWLAFSPFSSGKTYRSTLLSNLSVLHKLNPALLKKHAFAIRHMLLWKNLTWFSYLYCCVSPQYAAEKFTAVCEQNGLHASCLRQLASSSQAYYLPLIAPPTQHKAPPYLASTLSKSKLPAPSDASANAKDVTDTCYRPVITQSTLHPTLPCKHSG